MLSLGARAVQIFAFIISPAVTKIVSVRVCSTCVTMCNGLMVLGKVLMMSFLHTAVMSPTPAGAAQSFDPVTQEESWQLLAATLILFLSVSCDVVMTEVRWPTFQMTNNHSSLVPLPPTFDIICYSSTEMWMFWFWIRLGFTNPLIHHHWDETRPV